MDLKINLNPEKYCKFLLVIVIILIGMHLCLSYYNNEIAETAWLLHQLFELDEENNIPTWFSSFLLLNSALWLWIIAESKVDKHRIYWFILALGFLVLSVDEVAGLHETFNTAIDFNWAIVGAALVLIVAVAFVPFLIALPRKLAIWYVISGAIFIGGAVGVELLSEDLDEETFFYGIATAIEEGMEMLGALLFLFLNLQELKTPTDIGRGQA